MNPDPARAAPLSPVGPAGPAQAPRLRPIRTYVPRFRTTARTRGRLDALLPRYGVRALPLVPADAFGRVAPLVVEIGSGYGEAALGYAAAHPEHDVLAAEIHLPGVATMLAAADAAAINNLRVYPDDGLNLLNGGLPAGAAHGFVVVEIERPSWKSLDGFEAKGLAAGRAITYLAATPR